MEPSYSVGTLATPENLNQYKYNGDLPYEMTLKYVIEGFERVVFVVEVETDNSIEFMFMDNIEENYSAVIKNQSMIDLCNHIMKEYFKTRLN